MAELPDKSPGEIIDSAHINDIAARSVQRYADAAERSTLIPTPAQGSLSYLEDVDWVEVFNGSDWIRYAVYTDTVPDAAVFPVPVSPWSGTMTMVKQGGLVSCVVNVSRSAVTLNGPWTLFTTIPANLAPSLGSVHFQLSSLKSTAPGSDVIDMAQCSIGGGSSNLIVDSRVEAVIAMRGTFVYRVAD